VGWKLRHTITWWSEINGPFPHSLLSAGCLVKMQIVIQDGDMVRSSLKILFIEFHHPFVKLRKEREHRRMFKACGNIL
jgi:hypothetical protein